MRNDVDSKNEAKKLHLGELNDRIVDRTNGEDKDPVKKLISIIFLSEETQEYK